MKDGEREDSTQEKEIVAYLLPLKGLFLSWHTESVTL